MARVVTSLTIDRPAEEVFKFMADISNAKKKDQGVVEARFTSPEPTGVGRTFELKYPKQTLTQRAR
jgi:hypothetical protein